MAVSAHRTLAIAGRIVNQIVRDHRTLVMIIVAPTVVMALVGFSFADQPLILNRTAPALSAVFAFFFTFILTGVAFLRERSQGTLERLLTTPVGRGDILVGYLLGFLLFATLQTVVILLFTILVLEIAYQGDLWKIFILLMLLTVVGCSLGIFISTFSRNEFQVIQFIPLIFIPQIFLSGVILPVEQLPELFQVVAPILPLTHGVSGMRAIMLQGHSLTDIGTELGVLTSVAVVLIALAATTVRRN